MTTTDSIQQTNVGNQMYGEGWPCIPKIRRLRRAENTHRQMSQPGGPRIVYVDDATEDVTRAIDEFNDVFEVDEAERSAAIEGAILAQYLEEAPPIDIDPEERIGYLTDLTYSAIKQELGEDDGLLKRIPIAIAATNFTAAGSLSRSPDWMGMWTAFASLHDLQQPVCAIVHYNGGRIRSVFISNRVDGAFDERQIMPRTKESDAMRRILVYHGVQTIMTHPGDEEYAD